MTGEAQRTGHRRIVTGLDPAGESCILFVDRGVPHAWRNRGPEIAKMIFVNIDAVPVGAGATVE